MKLLWATRGLGWGFRILCHPADTEPLDLYRTAFQAVGDEYEVFLRQGSQAVLRFSDPEQRRDRAGRPIPHDFIVFENLAISASNVDSARSVIWPKVADIYQEIWDRPQGPAAGSVLVH